MTAIRKQHVQWGPLPNRDVKAAIVAAESFLARWRDRTTNSLRDDFSQQAVLVALSRWHTLRDRRCFHAYVRTVARRCRAGELARRSQWTMHSIDADWRIAEQIVQPESEESRFAVGGQQVSRDTLTSALPRAMAHLSRLNSQILMSYYEGFTCAELGVRYGLTTDSVKVRVHRSRRRVKQLLAAQVARAGRAGQGTGNRC